MATAEIHSAPHADLRTHYSLSDAQFRHIEAVDRGWRAMWEDPASATPKVIVHTPSVGAATQKQQFEQPLLMLEDQLATAHRHLNVGDDRVPSVRVEFGTGQPAAAFGCELDFPTNSRLAVKGHVYNSVDEVLATPVPSIEDGLYPLLASFVQTWREHMPEGIRIQHADIQSAFNTAHLVRGTDLFTDLYEEPEAVQILLEKITALMIKIVPWMHELAGSDADPKWFDDWGCRWPGRARISNCTSHMIKPDFYRRFVFPHDVRFMRAIGGGRVHYCGTFPEVIDEFCAIDQVHGLDVDFGIHDLWELSERVPERIVLCDSTGIGVSDPAFQRLAAGDWPRKRNIVIKLFASSLEEGREALKALRQAAPR